MMNAHPARLGSIAIAVCILSFGATERAAAQIKSTQYASGFATPVAFIQDPTDRTVQFVVQQNGHIRVVRNGTVLATDFLDLTSQIVSGGEQGLLGMALAPDYATTGRFFVNFTNTAGDTVVARFKRSAANVLVADATSRFDLRWGGAGGAAVIPQPFANHNGGNLVFGPDGFLYIGMGDGGSGDDPLNNSQTPSQLLGKMLRIDVNVPDAHPTGYQIPPNNPFADGGGIGARPEIWDFGVRNPWRFSFDDPTRGGTGALVIGDVGQNRFEEIDYEPVNSGGRNYGWRIREGAHDEVTTMPAAFLPLVDPIYEYDHTVGQSITGGVVYRGTALGAFYQGRYFFADYVARRVWSLALTINPANGTATASNLIEHTAQLGGSAVLGSVSSFAVDADGELYLVGHTLGAIFRVTTLAATLPAITSQPMNFRVPVGLPAGFFVTASGTPAPSFQWQVSTNAADSWTNLSDGGAYTGATTSGLIVVPPSTVLSGAQYRCVVTNAAGSVVSNSATLAVDGALFLTPTALQFAATRVGASGAPTTVTPPQDVMVGFNGSPQAWTVTTNQPWVQIVNGAGNGPGRFTVGIANPGNVLNTVTHATATISVTPTSGFAIILMVTLDVFNPSASAPPFGAFDTPTNGVTGVTGSIPVTGWALDDVSVSNVKVYRNCLSIDSAATCQNVQGASVVFIGDASFLPGARPDVEVLYPAYPAANRSGWGYLLLTNTLPHVTAPTNPSGGQGTLTLLAYATDSDSNRTLLGQKVITLDNDHGTQPFGAIDSPAQGGAVPDGLTNFGWVVTPGTAKIPTNGSTITVAVDGVAMGTVDYNHCRAGATDRPPAGTCRDDIALLFPTATNIASGSGAIGAFTLRTTGLTNGLHTIVWAVTDDQNRAAGIGSRFFTVQNGGSLTATGSGDARSLSALAAAPSQILGSEGDVSWRSVSPSDVEGRAGFDFGLQFETVRADTSGVRRVRIPELGRIELRLGPDTTAGYLRANGTLRPLPPGSQLDTTTGVFTWAPGPGYIGTYDLVFLQGTTQLPVSVAIELQSPEGAVQMRGWIDVPAARATVAGTFTVAGWALDAGAWQGPGVGAVHVWAKRRDVPAAGAVFLGAAAVGGVRPDVAAVYGPQFDASGWNLTASGLAPGTYDVTAYLWSSRTERFEDARTVTVIVR